MLAHSANNEGKVHSLVAHLRQTAELARGFGADFGADEVAYYAGLWHDLGKFTQKFQEYLAKGGHPPGPDHKSAGVALAAEAGLDMLAWVVAGHHGGLPSRDELLDRVGRKAQTDEVRRALAAAGAALPDLAPSQPTEQLLPGFLKDQQASLRETKLRTEFFTRMLFSALVDADYLDTERHLCPEHASGRVETSPLDELWRRLEAYQAARSGKKADALSRIRHEVYLRCLDAAQRPRGFFRLTVPTGGGKTRSAMAFALRHAIANGQRRVIVSIPYTSIIEQTAKTYREILGEEWVLEHHSEAEWRDDEDAPSSHQTWARLASENWDAPIVVTTNVQLFESLFSNRPARCRKLHNVAASVIILDEVQTLPPELLAPTLDALKEMVAHYRVSVVLCSATMPAFEDEVRSYRLHDVRDIVPNAIEHFQLLKRVNYEMPEPGDKWPWSRVAKEVQRQERCMAVVNTKKDAMALLDALADPQALHLSTYLCSAHRRQVLEEVRTRLKDSRPCRLVATQVVEAGVDLDFPMVLRAMGPLDRIVQAAGRCNREGRMERPGRVVVFEPESGGVPPGAYNRGVQVTRGLLVGGAPDMFSPDLYRRYFASLFPTGELDAKKVQDSRDRLDFPETARRFRLIADDTEPAVVLYEPERAQVEELLALVMDYKPGPRRPRQDGPRDLFRRLQPYVVNVWRNHVEELVRRGLLTLVREGLWEWRGAYDPVRGVGVPQAGLDPEPLVF